MTSQFLNIVSTPSVKAAQAANGSLAHYSKLQGSRISDRFTENEIAFIASRDSFYMATVTETGWPYIQHRGGPAGFLKVFDEQTLGFADFRGNRQYISVGNIAADNRAALFLMDYPRRARLKILAHVEIKDLASDSDLVRRFADPAYKARIERAMIFHLEAFDWNCSQHITPRFTEAEIAQAVRPLYARIEALQSANDTLRTALTDAKGHHAAPTGAAVDDSNFGPPAASQTDNSANTEECTGNTRPPKA